jgi:RNA polymerase sigma-70 factor (ECF subfamily)
MRPFHGPFVPRYWSSRGPGESLPSHVTFPVRPCHTGEFVSDSAETTVKPGSIHIVERPFPSKSAIHENDTRTASRIPDLLSREGRIPDFRSLVDLHQEKVRNTCYRYVQNREDADDLAQEVFIQVYESLRHFREEAELATWIYRIAVNKSLDFLRRQKRKKRFAWLVSLGDAEERDSRGLSAAGDPHSELEDAELKQILHAALGKLPENQQTAIILSKYQLLSNREIALIMDVTVSSVESLLHRAKANLQKVLSGYFTARE